MTESITEALGRRVVAADTAEELGEVKAFTVDPTGRRLTAIQVGGRKRNAQVVDWDAITAFGPDAVMVAGADRVHDVGSERVDEMVRGNVEYIGATILTTDGEIIGKVSEVHFDEASGDVTGLLGESGRIAGDRIRSLGGFAAVVEAGVQP